MKFMRDKSVWCERCQALRTITVDLGKGVVTNADMPQPCLWPAVCTELLKSGVFDRPFGEKGKEIA
ncbi:MAG TPA: hypothetical protein VFA81_10635 [Burkholderiales bacterium]|nr:hypothetical protein [Burkholderiales bacterium]